MRGRTQHATGGLGLKLLKLILSSSVSLFTEEIKEVPYVYLMQGLLSASKSHDV
jgi:hypothetical protein